MSTHQVYRSRIQMLIGLAWLIHLGCQSVGQTVSSTQSSLQEANGSEAPKPDHAGILSDLDADDLAAGRKIYNSICITCHGNLEVEGTLPTSRKFWEAEFKNGKDPYSLYLTLIQGYGQMPQFPFFTAKQCYQVIHYVRETLVKPNNPGQYFRVTEDYLQNLPKGTVTDEILTEEMRAFSDGPAYLKMNFGPVLLWTLQVDDDNIAYKGITARLDEGSGGVSKGKAWMTYDHDTLRVAAAWTGEDFIDWKGIAFDGSHGTHTRIVGDKTLVNPVGPGWANPLTGGWNDPRFRGRDEKPYGPLPRSWAQFKGYYLYGNRLILNYSVGDTEVLESPGYESEGGKPRFTRTLNIQKSNKDLLLRVSPDHGGVAIKTATKSPVSLESEAGFHNLRIPMESTPLDVKILMTKRQEDLTEEILSKTAPPEDLSPYTRGGPPKWNKTVTATGVTRRDDAAYVSDVIGVPNKEDNPWHSWMRLTGFDFAPGGQSAYVCTWMGDVWRVEGLADDVSQTEWTRVASGLFQPLGLLVRDDKILVACRDQIAELSDLNQDGEIDRYRCFNNDHQVTEHFHEFAMGLQQDDLGNFYYAKSARHALPALVPHHGTLLKVSPDGARTEIIANGFRAANGVCINEDGSFFVTDQEGHWTPKNRINWVRPGGFYGNMMGYHNQSSAADADMEQPMVWITNAMDRSPGELIWVRSGNQWGPLEGSLLNLSYGTGKVFLVPHEQVNGQLQGGVVQLPIPDFPTGVMRGRFHPVNGQLYACGMFAWAGNQQSDGGFYRIRYTGTEVALPIGLHAYRNGIGLTFTSPLNPSSASNPGRYKVKTWTIKRTQNYGSRHFDEKSLKITGVTVGRDAKEVRLEIPSIQPTRCMEIEYELEMKNGTKIRQKIHNTIHNLRPDQVADARSIGVKQFK